MINLIILGLKYTFLILSYLFLFWLIRLAAKDLRLRSPAESPRAKLVWTTEPDGDNWQSLTIGEEATIGRQPQNHLVLNDTAVSGYHARLFWDRGRYWLEDLDSTNGTYVNNQRIHAPVTLHSGAEIRIGRSRLLFKELADD